MPRAEERSVPSVGQPAGAQKAQKNYIAQTGGPGGPPSDAVPSGAGSDSSAGLDSAQALQSPVNQPMAPLNPDATWQPPKPEQETPNIDPATGFNMDEILMGPTQRPLEPVSAGNQTPAPQQNVSAAISNLVNTAPSEDLSALLRAAQNMGI